MKNNSKKKEEAPMGVSQWREHERNMGTGTFLKMKLSVKSAKRRGYKEVKNGFTKTSRIRPVIKN